MYAKLSLLSSQLIYSYVTSSLHGYTSFAHFTRFQKDCVNNRKKHKLYDLGVFNSSNHKHMLVELCLYLYCLNHTDCISWDDRNHGIVLELKFSDFVDFFGISNPEPYRSYLVGIVNNTLIGYNPNSSIVQCVTEQKKDKYTYFTVGLHGHAFWCCSNDFTEFNSRRFSKNLPSVPKNKNTLLVLFHLLTCIRCHYPYWGLSFDFSGYLPKSLERRTKFYTNLSLIVELLENSQMIRDSHQESYTSFAFVFTFYDRFKPKKLTKEL